MIFGQSKAVIRQRCQRTLAIEPGRGDKPGSAAPDHIFDQLAAIGHSAACLFAAQPQKLALARGHVFGLERGGAGMVGQIFVKPAMDKHFDALVGPIAQAALERRIGGQRRLTPMVRHYQHRELRPAQYTAELLGQLINLAFKTRANIVDRGEQEFGHDPSPYPLLGPGESIRLPASAGWRSGNCRHRPAPHQP